MLKKILIANRGEIALRILRSCQELDIKTVVIHSTADADAMHVRLADESVCVGPPASSKSYLNIPAILAAAHITDADAIHPGYGFLSENAEFAKAVEKEGLIFIGPKTEHISLMGHKIAAKEEAKRLGIPMIDGCNVHGLKDSESLEKAKELGFPIIIKAASGGGGRGMQLVERAEDYINSLGICRSESKAAFNDDTVYLEKYLRDPRHIEVQVMGDGKGKVLHFWERDCSLQRKHQKVVEEAPASVLSEGQRKEICEITAKALEKISYRGAGTVEYLYEKGEFFFIEMNTRIQVEHPVSEMISGHDLIALQLLVASGKELDIDQSDIPLKGHAIEMRVNAEDPITGAPQPGLIKTFHAAGGPGVRTDSHLFSGYHLPSHYDSMIAKVIVHAPDRQLAIKRMKRALHETVIEGIKTNIPTLIDILDSEDYIKGEYSINWLENKIANARE